MSIRYVHLNKGCYICKKSKVSEVKITKIANHMYEERVYYLCDKHKERVNVND